jgi:hypothetical protein
LGIGYPIECSGFTRADFSNEEIGVIFNGFGLLESMMHVVEELLLRSE